MTKKVSLDDKYTQRSGRVFLTGSQALARLPMLQQELDKAAGLETAGFISGYRGSPLGGFDKTLWQAQKHLKEHNIYFQPGVNEELAATSVWGSQQVNMFNGAKFDGVFSMWYGKGPGVDRSGDVFKHANNAGTSRFGGVLAIAGDDHGCKSSTLPHQSEYAFMDAMIPVLNPAGVQEIIEYGLYGWAMSRFSGCWVGLKTIAETVDASFSTNLDPTAIDIKIPEMPEQNLNIRWPDPPLEQELRLHNKKLKAVLEFARLNKLNKITLDTPAPRLGIVSTGKSYLDVLQALEDLGIDDELASEIGLRIYKVGMVWPLEPTGVLEFAEGLEDVLVVEEKRSLIEDQLTSQLYNWDSEVRPVVVGKHDHNGDWLLPSTGELTPAIIARALASRISQFFTSDKIEDRLSFLLEKEQFLSKPKDSIERVPHFCAGCPHNTSTVVPIGSRAMAGIGCHYMANWMDRETETFTQMGGEGATWIGQAPFTETKHVFQNLGDGTYFHSGLLAIRATQASGHNITYKILYNDAVAMTGGQPIDGQISVELMAHQVRDEGITRIAIVSDDIEKYERAHFPAGTTFNHRDNLDEVQCELRECKGTSVLIYDQTCAAEKRRRRKRGEAPDPQVRALINPLVCEGCGDCGKVSNCLAVVPLTTEYGRKRSIDQSACNKDMSCVKGFCPSFVTVEGGSLVQPGPLITPLDAKLPLPILPSIEEPYGIVLAGVGGTGVTTLGAILGMAAHLENRGASVLDMTGLAQKFGAVTTHLKIARDPDSLHAARIAAGGAKLVIGCDLVVSASNDALVKVKKDGAVAIINDHEAITSEFTRDPDARFPAESMRNLIRECTGESNAIFINATQIAKQYLGDTLGANIFLAGYAFQLGLIPISLDAILQAIELNGVSIKANQDAFRLGRSFANDPAGFMVEQEQKTVLSNIEEIVADRSEFLISYQNKSLARKYAGMIEKFRIKAVSVASNEAVEMLLVSLARNYFKVLAYKDEYEVARLYSNGEFEKNLASQFEGNFKLKLHLAPPLLAPIDPHTGKPIKITFGGWLLPVFKMLAKFKFLRNTKLDPFGYTEDRVLERIYIEEYEETLQRCLQLLDKNNISTIQEIITLPDSVRGFGHIKRQNLEQARIKQSALFAKLEDKPEPVKLMDPKAA